MDSAFRTAIPELSLAAIAQLSENSRLGFATRNPALYRGIEWSKSTLALGLPEWAGKTASGPVVAANNGPLLPDEEWRTATDSHVAKQEWLLITCEDNHENNALATIVAVVAAVREHCSDGRCSDPFRIPGLVGRSSPGCAHCCGNSMEHVGSHGMGQKEVSTTERPKGIHPHSRSLLCSPDFCWNVLR
jgi:hypothetical protein